MEIILVLVCVIIVILTASAAAYFYADSQADKRFIAKQSEWLEVEKKEKLEWASKALAKSGAKPLYHTPEKKEDPTPQKRVVTRAEAKAREVEKTPLNYPRVDEAIEKAKEILSK